MNRYFINLIFVVLFIPVTCPATENQKDSGNTDLLYGKWRFIAFQNNVSGSRTLLPDYVKNVHIEFKADRTETTNCAGKYKGKGPCNSYQGIFKVDSETIIFTNGIRTLKGCPTLEIWEDKYFSALYKAKTYEIRNNELRLYFDNHAEMLVFERVGD